ncbi:SRPBCC family protein [Kitasatospora cineracea]
MASIHKEFVVEAAPEAVWAVLSDYGAVHERLAPGFVTDTRLSSDTRTVTFADGTVVLERLVDLDHEARRVAYTVIGGTLHPSHHHASMQALPEPGGRTRFVWHTDVLPDTLAAPIAESVEHGSAVIRRTLESGTPEPRRRARRGSGG